MNVVKRGKRVDAEVDEAVLQNRKKMLGERGEERGMRTGKGKWGW